MDLNCATVSIVHHLYLYLKWRAKFAPQTRGCKANITRVIKRPKVSKLLIEMYIKGPARYLYLIVPVCEIVKLSVLTAGRGATESEAFVFFP